MTLSLPYRDIDARFQEARNLLSFIKSQESTATPPVDSGYVKSMRGLFYVHLYGAFERSVNDSVSTFIRGTVDLEVNVQHITPHFLPVALDARFKSLQGTQGSGNWKKRLEFVGAMIATGTCSINDALFSEHLQNAWPQTLAAVATYLGIGTPAFEASDVLAVDEVVDKRNAVAHGRASPAEIGASTRSGTLESRFDSTKAVLLRFMAHLEAGFDSLTCVRPEFRPLYQAPAAAGI
jgi:hypothetical protein